MSSPRSRRKKPVRGAAGGTAAPPARTWSAHHLVPPHEILSEEETQKILQKLGIAPERLPKVLVADPGLRTDPKFAQYKEAHEILAGRLVRVRRPSATAGEAVAYRMLIQNLGE